MNFEAKTRALKDIISVFKSFLKEQKEDVASVILQTVVEQHLKSLQEKIAVGLEDIFKAELESLKESTANSLSNYSRDWKVYNENHALVFPKNCRFMYTNHNNLVVVIEEDPKCRTLLLDGALVENNTTGRHYLSLPYVLFVFHFKNVKEDHSGEWKFVNGYTSWRNAPLKSINDQVCKPVLSNVQDDLKICFGNSVSEMKGKNIADKTQDLITAYWSSCFNGDLSIHWKGKKNIDKRLATVTTWKKHSQEEPEFILNCNWIPHHTLKKMLDAIVGGKYVSNFDDKLNELVDDYFVLMSKKAAELVNQKVHRFYPKDVVQSVAESMTPPFQKMIEALGILEKDVDKLAEIAHNSNKDISHYGFTAKGQRWR